MVEEGDLGDRGEGGLLGEETSGGERGRLDQGHRVHGLMNLLTNLRSVLSFLVIFERARMFFNLVGCRNKLLSSVLHLVSYKTKNIIRLKLWVVTYIF